MAEINDLSLYRTCLILGSGASVPYGLPTLGSLPDHVRRFVEVENDGPLVDAYRGASFIADALWGIDLEKDWIDYEEFMGVLACIARLGGSVRSSTSVFPGNGVRYVLENLPKLLFCAIDQNTVQMEGDAVVLGNRTEIYRKLLDRCWSYRVAQGRVPVLSCISLNYDCLIDDEMSDHIWGVTPDMTTDMTDFHFLPHYFVDFVHVSDGLHLLRKKPYKWTQSRYHELIKLHGSFDWLICSNCGAIHNIRFFRSFLSRQSPASLPADVRKLATQFVCQVCHGPVDQRLVAPILGKTEDSIARALWDAAFKSIATANKIMVIGYSFPPSDLPFRTLVQHALNWNDLRPEVVIIDPNGDEKFWERLEKLFPKNRISRFTPRVEGIEKFLSDTESAQQEPGADAKKPRRSG